LTHFFSQCTG